MNRYKVFVNGGPPFKVDADNYYYIANSKIVNFEYKLKVVLTVSIYNLIAILPLE